MKMLKWHAAVVIAAAGSFTAAELAAQSGDTRPIQVTANVKGSCRFDATPNINFGDLDPLNAADKDQVVNISFKCTKGVAYQLTIGNGQNYQGGKNRMRGASGGDFIPYDISPRTQGGNGQGFATAATVQITGSVKSADYQNVSAGAYADTVTLSIQP
jgi:spore coat protein U-like protein